LFLCHQTETATDDAVTFVGLVAVNGADYSMCSWVFSEASLLQQILRHETLTVHRSLACYTCRPTQSTATTSLLNFTHARLYLHQNFSRFENAADLSSSLTAQQRSWLSGCCFCCFYYRGMSGDQTTLTLGQCRQPVTYAYHTCIMTLGSFYLVIL